LGKVISGIFISLILVGLIILIPVISVSVILSPSSAIDTSSFETNLITKDNIIEDEIENTIEDIMEENLKYNQTTGRFVKKSQDKAIEKSNNLIAEYNENEFYRNKIKRILKRIDDKIDDILDDWWEAFLHPDRWAAKLAKWRIYEEIYEGKEDDREDKLKDLRKEIALLTANGKTYSNNFTDDEQIYKQELVGQENLIKLKDDLNNRIDRKLLEILITYARPDGLIKDQEVEIKDYGYKINSADLAREIVKEYIGVNSFLKYDFFSVDNDENLAYNSRNIEVFLDVYGNLETIVLAGEEHGGIDLTETYTIEKIPYYRKKKRFNIFIKDNDAVIENLLNKEDGIFANVIEQKGLTKEEAKNELILRMKEVPIINSGTSEYTNYEHFENLRRNNIPNRKYENRQQLINKLAAFGERDIIYFPNKSYTEYQSDLNLEIPKEFKEVKLKIPMELNIGFSSYFQVSNEEEYIVDRTNSLKEKHLYDDNSKPMIEIKNYGWYDSGKYSKAGLGNNGLIEVITEHKYNNMEELFRSATYLRERELEKGDIAFYTNPETSTNNLFGVYLGYEDLGFFEGFFKNANKHFVYYPIFLKNYPNDEYEDRIHAKEIKLEHKDVENSRELYMYMRYYPSQRGD
jgi:hypothetical protein